MTRINTKSNHENEDKKKKVVRSFQKAKKTKRNE